MNLIERGENSGPELPLPKIEYDKSLESAPYVVTVDPQGCAGLLSELGMQDEEIKKIAITRKSKIGSHPLVVLISSPRGYFSRFDKSITIFTDWAWKEYQKNLLLAERIIRGQERPKNQFVGKGFWTGVLYTKRLPAYLTGAPPERSKQFAQRLLALGAQRTLNVVFLHEYYHAFQYSRKPSQKDRRHAMGTNLLGDVVVGGSLLLPASGSLKLMEALSVNLPSEMQLTIALLVGSVGSMPVAYVIGRSLKIGPMTGLMIRSEMESEVDKFAKQHENNPKWRSLITITPKEQLGST